METPAALGAHHFHAGFGGEGVETAAVFGGNGGAADGGGSSSGRSHGGNFELLREL